jgi:hypothetical protein
MRNGKSGHKEAHKAHKGGEPSLVKVSFLRVVRIFAASLPLLIATLPAVAQSDTKEI